MIVWFDLANSPHVLFFRPIIQKLKEAGVESIITTRDFAQTVPLADSFNLRHKLIGRHAGKNRLAKALNFFRRAWALAKYIRKFDIDVAVSHNSYDQALACWILRKPLLTLMDYEYQPANHLSFRLARKILVPELFPDRALKKYGASKKKIYKYSGLKEEVYITGYVPEPSFMERLGINPAKIIVTMRPPATMALYHGFENPFFDELLDHLARKEDVFVIIVPRSEGQKKSLLEKGLKNLFMPEQVVNGLDLLYYSDLVIGAGGTMNREAALLGTPVYTIFFGKKPAVDQYLVESGRMFDLLDSGRLNLNLLHLEKKVHKISPLKSNTLQEITNEILNTKRR